MSAELPEILNNRLRLRLSTQGDSIVQHILLCGLLVSIVVAVYYPAHNAPFLWTDEILIAENIFLRSWHGIGPIWSCFNPIKSCGPLAESTYWLEYKIWSDRPFGYHITSIVIHALNTVLLWRFLRRLKISIAFFVAALFAVHPVSAHSVVWISQRPILLATFFSLVSLMLSPSFAPNDSRSARSRLARLRPLGAALAFVAAVLSGPIVLVLPVIVLVLLYWRHGTILPPARTGLSSISAIAIGCILLTFWFGDTPDGLHFWDIIQVTLQWNAAALRRLILPIYLAFEYPMDIAKWEILLTASLITVGIVAIYWSATLRTQRTLLSFFMTVIVLGASQCLTLAKPVPSIVATDQYLYIAGIPVIALFVALMKSIITSLAKPTKARWINIAAILLIPTVLGILTWRRASSYTNEINLWRSAQAQGPLSAEGDNRLGILLLNHGQPEQAAAQLQRAIQTDPKHLDAILNLARIYEVAGKSQEAILHYEAAKRVAANQGKSYSMLGALYTRLGRHEEALQEYLQAICISPYDDAIHNNLGLYYTERGQLSAGIQHFRRAIQINTYSIPARLNLAEALFRTGDFAAASMQLQKVNETDPKCYEAYLNSGSMLGRLKEFQKAERMFRVALGIKPDSAVAYDNLGIALAAQGRMSEALYCFGRAVDLEPNFIPARLHLERAQLEQSKSQSYK
jgi:protein O-mannosyl-transferase